LQFQPAVAGTLDAALPLLVRGSPPDQAQVTIDGITLYQMADPASGPTPYNSDSVGQAAFRKSPFAPSDGGYVAGALRLTGPTTNAGPTGFVDVSAFGASAGLQVPVSRWLSTTVSVRSSGPSDIYSETLERFSPRTGKSVRDRVPRYSGGPLAAAPTEPSYQDVNARFDLRPTTRDRVTVSYYDGDNDSDRSYDQAAPQPSSGSISIPQETGLPSDAVIEASKVQAWTSRGWSGAWFRGWSPVASSTFSIARSEYGKSASQAWVLTSPSTDQDYSDLESRGGSSGLAESNAVTETTFRADTSIAFGFAHVVTFGADVSSYDASYSARSEVTPVNNTGAAAPALVELLRQSGTGRATAFYVHDSWRPFGRVSIAPGLRVVRDGAAAATYIEPRVTASYQLRPDVRFTGGWSIDHQIMNRVMREDRSHGDSGFWALADDAAITVPRAQQAVAGLNVSRQGISFDLAGFYKRVDHMTLFAPRLYTGVAPDAGADPFYEGSRTAFGIESSLRYHAERNSLWLAYTAGHTEDDYPTLEAATFPASYDQINEVKVVDAVQIAKRWSVSGAFVVGSGKPYTPATGVETVWFPTGKVVSQVTFGDKNGSRLPAYHRLDVATERTFAFGRLATSLGATVFNVYNQDSVMAIEYDSVAGALSGQNVLQMGRTFNAFVRVKF
jgi:ferric enterobactin receptor